MKIVVSSIDREGLQQEMDISLAIENNTPKDNVHVSLRVNKHEKSVLLDGNAETTISLVCSRCLKRFLYPLNVNFKEEYVQMPEAGTGIEHELTSEELDVNFYSNDEINIDDFIREQLVLSLPVKPLCSPDCQGICPKCGKDLNEGLCNCKEKYVDPRLISLKELKESLKYRKE